jgi:hypothetical protein
MDVSKLISTSPLEYQSQKLNYSVLISELNNDLTFPNLANTDLTSSIAGRSFYLYGNTGSDSLRFRSLAGNQILSLYGSGGVVIGNATTYGALQIYLSALDANGDLYYRNAGGNVAALPIGTAGQVLTVSGGGIPSWATISAPNLGSANLTSTDDARTFTLKSGGTASQYLNITNGVNDIIRFRGDKQSVFGDTSTYLKIDPYGVSSFGILQFAASGTSIFYNAYNSSSSEVYRFSTSGQLMAVRPAGISTYLNYNASINLWTEGTNSNFHLVGTNGSNHTIYIGNTGGHGYVDVHNSAGATKVWLVGSGDSYFLNNLAIGGSSAAARFDVKGSGATSATTTALFQNSASVSALKVKDDGYCILKANNAAIASGDLANNEMSFYIDEGTNHCVVKVKYSSGTVKTGTFNLT